MIDILIVSDRWAMYVNRKFDFLGSLSHAVETGPDPTKAPVSDRIRTHVQKKPILETFNGYSMIIMNNCLF